MIVLDTNVLVRVITKDDVDQARQAAELLAGAGPFWISRVALLETGWTLKSHYGYTRAAVSRALHVVVSLAGVQVEDDAQVCVALGLHATGMDLGDAFILATAPPGATVTSFDDRLRKRAKKATGVPPVKHPKDCT